ncbi:hypothetical protein QYF61_010614 [Mycteria americana]|uniref:Uncharacterized protein n=1 Tax=Mycteria americana TaxID=33587 RepID=A0AAN7S6X1_MYCAM|nr:hypothetical protein QYF61_010614 [Mycteria americana]
MPCGGGYSSRRRPIDSAGLNPSGLLHCGETLLLGQKNITLKAHKASGHLGRDTMYRRARDRGVDLTMQPSHKSHMNVKRVPQTSKPHE